MTGRKIAVYGKGGIGKSTISSNLSAALSQKGVKVLQIGCDPKHDSTRLLTGSGMGGTVLDYLKNVRQDDRKLEDVVTVGYGGTLCVEAGGPEPGVGCAGRGIISAFDLLTDLGIDSLDYDMTIYDVLGDVVCGGFAVPIRNEYADTVYIVTSGEFMSIYAANNILRGVANYNPDRIGGIIFNSRGDDYETVRVETFARAVGLPIVARIPRSPMFLEAEQECKTIIERFPDSDLASSFRDLSNVVLKGDRYCARPLPEDDLERIVLGHERQSFVGRSQRLTVEKKEAPKIYSSRSVKGKDALQGCAFSGACSVAASIDGLAIIIHAPRNCAQFAFQLASSSVKRAYVSGRAAAQGYIEPDVVCTRMDEPSMIFGGTERLRSALDDMLSSGRRNIAVITGCAPGIIGDDTAGVIRSESEKYPDAKIVPIIEDGNLKGDHMQGMIDACIAITKGLSVPSQKKSDKINLVGMKPMATNVIENVESVRSILAPLGIGIGCCFMGDCSVSDVEHMSESKLSLLITVDQFAEMQKKFLIDSYGLAFSQEPIGTGIGSTERWLIEVGRAFGKESEASAAMADIRKQYLVRLEHVKGCFNGKRVCVVTMHMNVDWLLEILEDMGAVVTKAFVINRRDHTLDLDVKIRHPGISIVAMDQMATVRKKIEEASPDMIFNMYIDNLTDDSVKQFKIPLVPDLGPFGGLNEAERWMRSMKRPATEGWRKDVL
jgi:nitrogenase iron protein NifH